MPQQPLRSPHVIWASVAIVFMLVAGVVVLASMDKDVVVLISLAGIVAVPVLSAFGAAVYQKLDQVRDQGNGRETEHLKMIRELQSQVAVFALQVKPMEIKEEESGRDEYTP